MTYCYYWYNFMPLARGTAAVGYTTMLGLFWGAGMPVTATIPKDYQVMGLQRWEGAVGGESALWVGLGTRVCDGTVVRQVGEVP